MLHLSLNNVSDTACPSLPIKPAGKTSGRAGASMSPRLPPAGCQSSLCISVTSTSGAAKKMNSSNSIQRPRGLRS